MKLIFHLKNQPCFAKDLVRAQFDEAKTAQNETDNQDVNSIVSEGREAADHGKNKEKSSISNRVPAYLITSVHNYNRFHYMLFYYYY